MPNTMFSADTIIQCTALLGGNADMARKVAELFEQDPNLRKLTSKLTADEKKALRIRNLEVANARRAEKWQEVQECVKKIVLDMRAADPDVSLTELCVAINQAGHPTYRPSIHPFWTPSMVERFIRTSDAKQKTP